MPAIREKRKTQKKTEKLMKGAYLLAIHLRIGFYICLPFHLIERANDLFESQLTECRVGGMDRKRQGKQA